MTGRCTSLGLWVCSSRFQLGHCKNMFGLFIGDLSAAVWSLECMRFFGKAQVQFFSCQHALHFEILNDKIQISLWFTFFFPYGYGCGYQTFPSMMILTCGYQTFFCLLTSGACLSCNCACYGLLACNEGKILTSLQICPRFYSTKHASFPWWVWGLQQAQCDVEGLKIQLEEAKIEKRHKEECEAIRRLITAQPPQQHLIDFEKEVVG